MKNKIIIIVLLLLNYSLLFAQVAINTDGSDPDNSAIFDVKSTSRGFLPPRMTQAERNAISVPADGLLVFCTDCGSGSLGTLTMFMAGQWYKFSANCVVQITPGTHVASPTQIVWNWNSVFGATGYKWNTANDYGTATDMGTATTETEIGLTCNTAYIRYAWAYNACGNSIAVSLNQTTSACPCPGTPTVTYGGQVYNTVQIESQCWMKENLNIGTRINGSQSQTDNSVIEKYCYNDLESNCNIYGGLYMWGELMQYVTTLGAQGICPSGWHVPTYNELCQMTHYLDPTVQCSCGPCTMGIDAGGKMKETDTIHWIYPNIGATNESGFTALPGGRWWNGWGYKYFEGFGASAEFWTSSNNGTSTDASMLQLSNSYSDVQYGTLYMTCGLSVRCLKDN